MPIIVSYISETYQIEVNSVGSNCCDASPVGEVIGNEARCSECKEMAAF